jgi:hypothetical protein
LTVRGGNSGGTLGRDANHGLALSWVELMTHDFHEIDAEGKLRPRLLCLFHRHLSLARRDEPGQDGTLRHAEQLIPILALV